MRSSLTAQPLTSAARQKFLTSFIDTGFFSPAPLLTTDGLFLPTCTRGDKGDKEVLFF